MVATQSAPGRAVAAVLIALLLAVVIPAPAAQAQTTRDVSVQPGEARFYQDNFHDGNRPTVFIDSGYGDSTLRVPVYNSANTAVTNVPVYFYSVPDRAISGCKFIDIPPATPDGPSNATASFTFTTGNLEPGAYNFTVEAFVYPKPAISAPCPSVQGPVSVAQPPADDPSASHCVTRANLSCHVDPDMANNRAVAYMVKDQFLNLEINEIRWCQGLKGAAPCDTAMEDAGGQYNVTPTTPSLVRTYFEIEVENVGSWPYMSNYGGCRTACESAGFEYTVNISLLGPEDEPLYVSVVTNTTTLTDTGEGRTQRVRSGYFNLNDRAGVYNVTVQLDRGIALRRHGDDTIPDVGQRDVDIAYRDFTGSFNATEFKTTAQNAYEHRAGEIIKGGLVFVNQGTAGRPATTVNYRVYLDNLTSNTLFIKEGEFTPTGNVYDEGENVLFVPISWEFTDNPAAQRYLPPGEHTIIAEIDSTYALKEVDETNNNFTLDIFIEDATKPKFLGLPAITLVELRTATTTVRPHEAFNMHVDVQDDDERLTVIGNFTLDSNESVYRLVRANRTLGDTFHFRAASFGYHNFSARAADGSENWTLRIVANDTANNVTSGNVSLKLTPWPIHEASEIYVVRGPAWPHATRDYAASGDPQWTILVEPNMTGYDGIADRPQQQMQISNLAFNVTTLQRTFDQDSTFWFAESDPTVCPAEPEEGDKLFPGGPTCVGEDAARNNTFTARFAKDQEGAGPGLWNYSLRVADVAGEVRIINGTLLLADLRPSVDWSNINLTTVIPSAGNLTTVNITGNFSDDSNQVNAVHVNFTRFEPNDTARINLSVPRVDNGEVGGIAWYNHTLHMEVGRGKMFGLGGKFTARLEVRDLAGNWNFADLGTFEVKDDEAPRVLTYGIAPATPEVGENVTFYATANDATNVTMRFEVFRTSTVGELLFDPVFVNQSETMNYTFTTNFTTEAVHAWRATPVDGLNRAGEARLSTITVRDNLGPKYDVRSPSVTIDGTRYASGTPRIEIQIADIEGVVLSSIDVKVAGLPVEFEVAPAPGNVTGYLVVHEVRGAKKFNHLDVVEVNVTAQDNSTERLETYLNFSFVVDDVAPTTRLLSISPSYRDQPGHVLNVSLASRFTLAAEDVDNLPTGVPTEGIRYRILGGGPSAAETIYTGPFRIDDATGVYTGPRLYQIQFWAEDAVGNFNPTPNVTTVFVDDTPPALFQFFPQGRNVNATFVDDRVGVNRSVVWYRLNEQPFVPISLIEQEGAWTVALPEGVKGDRMSYYLQAWDRLDNTETFGNATNPYASFDVSNHEPNIRITAPVEGSRISRSVDLTWEASDEDNDALVYTVYMKAPGRTTYAELVKIENTAVKRYTIDTARYPDGQYTFRVAASDGGFVKLAETTVTVLNRAEAVGIVSIVGDALPGETLLIKAEVTKAEAVVEARLYLGRTLVNSWAMNDEGRDGDEAANDGIYSVRVPVDAAGDYRVEIFTRYREDGVEKESTLTSAATFSAKMTPTYVLSHYGAILVLIALLAVVGIGVAVFIVARRR